LWCFRSAIGSLGFHNPTPQHLFSALVVLLPPPRQRDALTLWHLLSRVDEPQRAQVFNRLVAFVPLPAGVTQAGILRLDQPMLDRWWNDLGFDDISVWRHWERSWSGSTPQAIAK
jgi:hypothetical protein